MHFVHVLYLGMQSLLPQCAPETRSLGPVYTIFYLKSIETASRSSFGADTNIGIQMVILFLRHPHV